DVIGVSSLRENFKYKHVKLTLYFDGSTMGTWGTTSASFKSFFSDRIGYKSGLALDNNEIIQLLDKNDPLLDIFTNHKEELC
ncbi:hypothetical protein NL505_28985, partial [Klebsiella pneumoniae]|nr:hypothetical protein [Klebsiella pneumoniae]